MTFTRLLLRNLAFHWRGNLAVLLGVAVGAAVLAGALLVGDSLRGSLKAQADRQRCGVEYALVSGKFFKAEANVQATRPDALIRSGIILRGSILAGDESAPRAVNQVTIMWPLDPEDFRQREAVAGAWPSNQDGEAENARVEQFDRTLRLSKANSRRGGAIRMPASIARELGVEVGDWVRVRYQMLSSSPHESLLGRRDSGAAQAEETAVVAEIVPNDSALARFQLAPGATSPRNVVFVSSSLFPKGLPQHLEADSEDLSSPHNAILARGVDRARLEAQLKANFSLNDWGVNVTQRPGYLAIESRQTLLEPAVVAGVERAAAGLRTAPTLVYLANSIGTPGKEPIPYSVVAALDPAAAPPLGPFLPPGVDSLKDDEIILADWPESPLRGLPAGTQIALTYFEPETRDGRLVENRVFFGLRGYVPMTGAAADPNLTPVFPGITDKLDIRQWDPPFPYDNRKLKPRDEKYWREHKATPKAYVTLATGRKLWGSRFGDLTSVRVAGVTDLPAFKESLRSTLKPEDGGFVFDDVKARFDAASQGGQDFGGLFLGFSFFLIAAALLLVGLLTRLNLERRASEIGLLLATGWRVGQVRWLLLLEGVVVAAVGGVLGLVGAVAYAWAMLRLLAWLWPDAAVGSFLKLHVGPMSLVIGYVATLLISAGAILWALRLVKRVSPSALLAGAGSIAPAEVGPTRRGRWLLISTAVAVVVGIGSLAGGAFLPDPEMRAGSFFGGGFLLLAAALAGVWLWLKREQSAAFAKPGPAALLKLGASNAKRYPARSLLTAGLLASAAFLLVAVESFRRQPERDFAQRTGGSGGFAYIVETDLPLYRDPNTDGRDDLLDALRMRYQNSPDPARSTEQRIEDAKAALEQTTIYPFRLRAGDDASCLNLYQAGRPRLLGVPARFGAEPVRFRFVATEAANPAEEANPWLVLQRPRDDGAIPVFGEANTLQWMLKKGLGDDLEVPDEQGRPVKLHVAGVLKDSIFPSELLLSAGNFERLYPRQEGFPYFLVDSADPAKADAIADLLRTGLAKQGPEITRPRDRVAAYLAVENTYLTTFQLLGGLGLLLGASGLAVVLLRGVWERRGELALLRALGYRNRALGGLVMAENGLLLLLGLAAGVGTALLSVLPHLAAGGSVPWLRLAVLLGLVLLAGLSAGLWAVRATVRAPLLPALRRE